MFWIEFTIVLACIYFGSRIGGIALGAVAGLGMTLLVFGFRITPGAIPIDVILIIIAVVTAVSALQAAGGLDWMVHIADRILRAKPGAITFVAPAVSWVFTFFAGTGHVSYALLPVIAETARKAGVRPERPLSISVIASQQAITASPISAATAGMLALFAVNELNLGLAQILMVCIPSTILGSMLGALAVAGMGKKLKDDPVYIDRLSKGLIHDTQPDQENQQSQRAGARLSVAVFLTAAIGIVVLGLVSQTRPVTGWTTTASTHSVAQIDGVSYAFTVNLQTDDITRSRVTASHTPRKGWVDISDLDANTGILQLKTTKETQRLVNNDSSGLHDRIESGDLRVRMPSPQRVPMASTIEIIMLGAAGIILILSRASPADVVKGTVARAGVVAVVSIMGIAWLGSTFFESNSETIVGTLAGTVQRMPWTFSIALFVLSILLYSQAATVAALMGVGLQLGIEPKYLIAMFPAVNGYFFLPTYATVLAAIQFDQTGTTHIGKYVLNHSFMIPGLVATASSVTFGFVFVAIFL